MKCSLRVVIFGLMLAAMPIFTSGCVTHALWKKTSYQPAEYPRLSLASSAQANDVLVCYDEQCARSSKVRLRAYWLFAHSLNDTNSFKHPKPGFINPAVCTNLSPVAILIGAAATNVISTNGYCALPASDQRSFRLWWKGTELGTYNLPIYSNAPPATFWRVAMTPAAVAADTAIVAVIMGFWGMSAGMGPGGA